jgi:hypothetical protein
MLSPDNINKTKPYNKKYLPGYTGYVPQKHFNFAMTCGDYNRFVNRQNQEGYSLPTGGTHQQRFYRPVTAKEGKHAFEVRQNMPKSNKSNKDQYGNHSRNAVNWMAGPMHRVV